MSLSLALHALGARLPVPHDIGRLKWIDDQELTLQNFRFQFSRFMFENCDRVIKNLNASARVLPNITSSANAGSILLRNHYFFQLSFSSNTS
jgi:hypothetical protein